MLDRVHEAAQRALGPVAHGLAEAAGHRARVVGHLAANRANGLGGELRENQARYPLQPRGRSPPFAHNLQILRHRDGEIRQEPLELGL